jgi:hypothetical protein
MTTNENCSRPGRRQLFVRSPAWHDGAPLLSHHPDPANFPRQNGVSGTDSIAGEQFLFEKRLSPARCSTGCDNVAKQQGGFVVLAA